MGKKIIAIGDYKYDRATTIQHNNCVNLTPNGFTTSSDVKDFRHTLTEDPATIKIIGLHSYLGDTNNKSFVPCSKRNFTTTSLFISNAAAHDKPEHVTFYAVVEDPNYELETDLYLKVKNGVVDFKTSHFEDSGIEYNLFYSDSVTIKLPNFTTYHTIIKINSKNIYMSFIIYESANISGYTALQFKTIDTDTLVEPSTVDFEIYTFKYPQTPIA